MTGTVIFITRDLPHPEKTEGKQAKSAWIKAVRADGKQLPPTTNNPKYLPQVLDCADSQAEFFVELWSADV
jgi:hypothetical protein